MILPTKNAVIVTGGSGFVGGYIVRELLSMGHRVRVVGRSPVNTSPVPSGAEYEAHDLSRGADLESVIEGFPTVIHLVGIIQEHRRKGITFESVNRDATRHLVRAAVSTGVSSFIQMSANGARQEGVSRYQTSKWEAEEIVRSAGFDSWTIFRPSVIFGKPEPGRRELTTQLVDTLIKPLPVWPIFGDGKYRLQPIAVEDVARAFSMAASSFSFRNRSHCLAGPESFTFLETLDLVADAANLKIRPKLHQPVWLARRTVSVAESMGVLPITSDQLEMLLDGNTCENADFEKHFGRAPIRFNRETLRYLRDLE